jgi:hypothetical protein
MAQETIDVGTVADDETGDPLRTGFIKINSNFDELYDCREVSFDNTDLTANVLTVTVGNFAIYDNNGALVSVDVTRVSATEFTIDFGAAITGTWIMVI